MTTDTLRAVFGPPPYFICSISVFIKHCFFLNVAQNILAITVVKSILILFFKSFPIMNDQFLSFYIFVLVHLISIYINILRFMAFQKPLRHQVCIGNPNVDLFTMVTKSTVQPTVPIQPDLARLALILLDP